MPDDVSALQLLLAGDSALLAIVRLSLIVSLSAVIFGGLIGVPCGAAVALTRFPGREAVIVILNALMGLPPVVVGLAVYLLLSRSGPLGSWGLLFTPQAMIVAQTVLIAPIIAALARQTVEDLWSEYRDELAAMDVGPLGRIATLIRDGRFSLVTALLAGFGRAAAEVGAVLILDRISLVLVAGSPTVLIGPNGAGKTTLLRLVMGLIAPTRGRVTWGGREQASPTHRAIVFQRPAMLRRSAAGNIRYALAAAGVPRARRAAHAL